MPVAVPAAVEMLNDTMGRLAASPPPDELEVRQIIWRLSRPIPAEYEAQRLTRLGMAYALLGDKDEALRHHREAVGLDPMGSTIHQLNFAATLVRFGLFVEALDATGHAYEIKQSVEVLGRMGFLFARLGFPEDAEWAADEILASPGLHPSRRVTVAAMLALAHNHTRAIAELAQYVRDFIAENPKLEEQLPPALAGESTAGFLERTRPFWEHVVRRMLTDAAWGVDALLYAIAWNREVSSWPGGRAPEGQEPSQEVMQSAMAREAEAFEATKELRQAATAAVLGAIENG
jgi:tetratricopeptide (TPR) repeat protein